MTATETFGAVPSKTLRLYLFDDQNARDWDPFSLTRPVGELLFGALLLRQRAERLWGLPCSGHISRPELLGFSEPSAAPTVPLEEVPTHVDRLFLSARAALTGNAPDVPEAPASFELGGEAVGFFFPSGQPNPDPELLAVPSHPPGFLRIPVQGQLLDAPWSLMGRNGKQLQEDIPRFFPGYAVGDLAGSHILGTHLVSVGEDVEVEPGCVIDARKGPVRLSDGVRVRASTRLEGPAFVGSGTTLLGGSLSEVSVGPVCKVRGEVECSVILGYANKAHDGFLGHAYVGRWVNLGALTTNSDLKNNYGPVRVGGARGPRETGLMKVGCFLGDHVKTGIGTLLNTGTVVGAGSNLFGGGMPPIFVPPFSWGSGQELTEFRLDKFLDVARKAMGRRNMELDEAMESLLRRAFEASRPLR